MGPQDDPIYVHNQILSRSFVYTVPCLMSAQDFHAFISLTVLISNAWCKFPTTIQVTFLLYSKVAVFRFQSSERSKQAQRLELHPKPKFSLEVHLYCLARGLTQGSQLRQLPRVPRSHSYQQPQALGLFIQPAIQRQKPRHTHL